MLDYEIFIKELKEGIQNQDLIKISLGHYKGDEIDLKNIYIRLLLIKNELKLSFIYRYKTKDITKNYSISQAIDKIIELTQFKGFRAISMLRNDENVHLQMNKKAQWNLNRTKESKKMEATLVHDKKKERKLDPVEKRYLHELKLTDVDGQVYKSSQDKWKQINHYIELLSTSLINLPSESKINVVDMGAGKGYLTFALYDYLKNELKKDTEVIGVEYRKDLVEFCNDVAKRANFDQLSFVQGTIEDFESQKPIDVLIALHACDTATDDAIYKGILKQSSLIVVAPCCHKQIRRELERMKPVNDLDFMCQYGIFLERHAEMLTDSIRALILEYYGYQTKVMQFISDQHTPKNVMIVGVKSQIQQDRQKQILTKLKSLKSYFGIKHHHLESLCGLSDLN